MVASVALVASTWKVLVPPLELSNVKMAGVLVNGPLASVLVMLVSTTELWRMNALVVSNVFVLVNDAVTFPPDTDTPVIAGGGTATVRMPALLMLVAAELPT